jgi:hypothetical protein
MTKRQRPVHPIFRGDVVHSGNVASILYRAMTEEWQAGDGGFTSDAFRNCPTESIGESL